MRAFFGTIYRLDDSDDVGIALNDWKWPNQSMIYRFNNGEPFPS